MIHGLFFRDLELDHIGEIVKECYVDRLFDRYLRPGMGPVLEVGGNVGLVTFYLAQFAAGRLYVMEPCPDHLELLRRTALFNDLRGVTIIPAALAASDGRRLLHLNPDNSTMHSLVGDHEGEPAVEVDCFSLSTVMRAYGIEAIDFLKMDAEGAEFEILAGESFQREAHRIRAMVIECHEVTRSSEIVDSLSSAGFTFTGKKRGNSVIFEAWRPCTT